MKNIKNLFSKNIVLIFEISIFTILAYILNNIVYMLRLNNFNKNFLKEINFSFDISDILFTIFFTFIIYIAYKQYSKNRKTKLKMLKHKNKEYGSAEWGTREDIAPFIDKDFSKNILFTETERLTLEIEREDFKLNRNHNSIIVGMPGTGKTWLFIVSNLLQNTGSYVVTDTKGSTIKLTGHFMKEKKKDIKVFNTKNPELSLKYNPFSYIKNELDILSITNTIMNATEDVGTNKGDSFWIKAERLFFTAIIGYLFETQPFEKINIKHFLDIIIEVRNAENENNNEDEVSDEVDMMFKDLEAKEGNVFAVRQYKKYLTGATKSKSSIILSVCARMSVFDIDVIRDLTSEDQLELNNLANGNTILYIITSDSDRTLDFLNSVLYSQLIQILYKEADDNYGGSFPKPVSLFLDEFKQLRINNFEDIISTNRSRNIPIHILIQATSQLKEAYKESYSSIMGNCDSYLFLGSKEKETLKDLSETLDKATILETNSSQTYSNNRSSSQSEKNTGRNLLSVGELTKLRQDECIYILRGLSPFKSKKYMTNKHNNYNKLYHVKEEFDKKTKQKVIKKYNVFDLKEYIKKYEEENNKISFTNSTIVEEYEFIES